MFIVEEFLKQCSYEKIWQLMDELLKRTMIESYGTQQPKELAKLFNISKLNHLCVFNTPYLIETIKIIRDMEINIMLLSRGASHFNPSVFGWGNEKYIRFLEEIKSKREKLPYTISPDSIAKFFKPIERSGANEKDYKNYTFDEKYV